MISRNLVEQIQKHSGRLAHEVVDQVKYDSRFSGYRGLPPVELQEASEGLFQELGLWLTARTDSAIDRRYRKIGRKRYEQQIPLSQVLLALQVVKGSLLEFIRGSSVGDAREAPLEQELVAAIHQFIDKAVFAAAIGYEDSMAAAVVAEPADKTGATAVSIAERLRDAAPDLDDWNPVSRGGDVGEVSG